jgi:hypothetical protein
VFLCFSWELALREAQEKNVFILEGTKASGFSGCCYGGSCEERRLLTEGHLGHTLTAEVKSCPAEQMLG